MTAPASEDLRELARELEIRAEQGETVTFAELREQFGLGHEDLETALSALREHGKAVEVAPGEWRGPMFDELPATEPRVSVSVPDREPEEAVGEAGRPAPFDRVRSGVGVLASAATVRLTRAIADALDAEAIGKIVKAGLDGVDGADTFVLEVLP